MAQIKVAVRLDALRIPLRKSLEMAARLGAGAVELDARHQIPPSQLSDTGLRQLRKILDDLNLQVASLRFQTHRGYEVVDDLDRRIEATKDAMRLAYRLNCPVVVNSIGQIPDDEDDPRWSSLQLVLDDLGRFGTRVGAFLAAETGSNSGETLAKILDCSPDGFVAVALNPGRLIVNRFDVPAAVAALKERIQLVCAVDGVLDLAAGRGVEVRVGQGTADFPTLIGMLEDVQYRGYFLVGRENSELADLQQGIEYLQNL